jgi:uncharacterized membrane protein
MRRLAVLSAAALLCACQPQASDDTPEAPAAPAPAANTPATPPAPAAPALSQAEIDYRSTLRLTGTEPFWGVQIKANQITMQRPDYADMTVINPGPAISGDTATWTGQGLTVTLKPADCSDGMSDNHYPYEATVTVGAEVLKGCGARLDQWPKGG